MTASIVELHVGSASGRLVAPPSKSYTHRALMLAHQARRPYVIDHPLRADDTVATRNGIAKLGHLVRAGPDRWLVTPRLLRRGRRGLVIDCRGSGTTLRFLLAAAAALPSATRFRGDESLARRPLAGLEDSLRENGARIIHADRRTLPLTISGPIRAGAFHVDGTRSSQFSSSLLLTLPFLTGDSSLEIEGPLVSGIYLEATAAILAHHGIRLRREGGSWKVPGDQSVRRRGFTIPGDWSSAAYWAVAAAVTGGKVRIDGVSRRWPQADSRILDILSGAGVHVLQRSTWVEVEGRPATGFDVDLTSSPDLYPLLAAAACTIPEESRLRGAPQLVHKESDRIAETRRMLTAAGASFRMGRRGLLIRGQRRIRPFGRIQFFDHRMVMAAAVASLAAGGPSRIGDFEAVRKSFPGFWSGLRHLGVEVRLR
ncbi:MAG TPA: 3-phosphoshikimate 1-carboxyvinyltransferase [Thermoplasmata archaeon]|nr:3-phosphoshikimate 1-carboxyvinyltransferase [Thermoplasmata archaeon]